MAESISESLAQEFIESGAEEQVLHFLRSGVYHHSIQLEQFEKAISDYIGSLYTVGVSNGSDALILALDSLKLPKNTPVIIPNNTFISDAFAVLKSGNRLVIADCWDDHQMDLIQVEDWLRHKRHLYEKVVILPTHMYGIPADVSRLAELIDTYKVIVIEDCSHAFGTETKLGKVGVFGTMGIFSAYSTKNLGSIGESGFITTNRGNYKESLEKLRNIGKDGYYVYPEVGYNARMENIHAIILKAKLPLVDKWIEHKNKIANMYRKGLKISDIVSLPMIPNYATKINYHHYVIRVPEKDRDMLKAYLDKQFGDIGIHYPVPITKQLSIKDCEVISDLQHSLTYAKEIISLPIYSYITEDKVSRIIESIRKFYAV